MAALGKAPTVPSWMRRVVPSGYVEATLLLEGTAPLLMNNGETDRDSELYRTFFLLGKKKGKSLDDDARLRELEWQLNIYLDDELGPYIPGKNVKELLRESATKWRKGEEIKRSLVVVENRIPLTYDGPRDQDGLWAKGFRFSTMAKNAGAGSGSVYRCRPKFDTWALTASIAFDPEDLDFDFLGLVVERSQKYGLGDWRPTFGSFRATLTAGQTRKKGARAPAATSRNGTDEAAHKAFTERIMVGAE